MTKKSGEKHKKRSSKQSRKQSSAAVQHALLKYAAMGKGKKLQKLLKGHPAVDLDAVDSRGDTALHHACRGNHIDFTRILLRRVLRVLMSSCLCEMLGPLCRLWCWSPMQERRRHQRAER
jgi:ankyrin repeat protein